jgi:hypothetical protein
MALFRETGDDRWRAIVERTLDAMATAACGTRAAAASTATRPRVTGSCRTREKLLETNAELLRAYAEAALVFERPVDRDRCAAIAGFITGRRSAPRPAATRQRRRRHALHGRQRRAPARWSGPRPSRRQRPGAGSARPRSSASSCLCYKPSRGWRHYSDGVPGARTARRPIYTAGALLDAHDVSALEPYKMMAEELTHVAVRQLWDEDRWRFFDRAASEADIGLLRTGGKPFVVNAEAASMLARLERTADAAIPRARRGRAARRAAQLAGRAARRALRARARGTAVRRPVIS